MGDFMNISTKGKYAIASMLYIAKKRNTDQSISLMTIAENLNISKIYLEQIFSSLKKANLVDSIKGPNGGYQLRKTPNNITLFEILKATESNLSNKKILIEKKEIIEIIITNHILDKIDESIIQILSNITLENLLENIDDYNNNVSFMYYI